MPTNVLMVCSELAPLAKTGGLADAVAGLSGTLGRRGNDVTVLLPRYAHIKAPAVTNRVLARGTSIETIASENCGYRICLVNAPALFSKTPIYTGSDRDAARFFALSEVALRLPEALSLPVDVLHCHDWHAALVPVLDRSAHTAPTLLTIHNIGYQGDFPADALEARRHREIEVAIENRRLNFLRSGIRSADMISTVSPNYAREILTEPFAMGLSDSLDARRDDLVGILNGVDYSTWSPESDPYIEAHYDAGDTRPKHSIKAALMAELGLGDRPHRPLIGLVTRLAEQKGVDLLIAALPALLEETDALFVVLGSGETPVAEALADRAAATPTRVSFTDGFDEALAHRIIAASDIVLVPSRYEPCGLTQLYALRYGSIPVVRRTGGLADTVRHFDAASGIGNGSVFEHADVQALSWAIKTALDWYGDKSVWSQLVGNAMREDHSWDSRAAAYEAVYARLARR